MRDLLVDSVLLVRALHFIEVDEGLDGVLVSHFRRSLGDQAQKSERLKSQADFSEFVLLQLHQLQRVA